MIIFSHRGISKEGRHNFKENTKDALLFMLENNFSVEIDVRETRDKEIIISHDNNLKNFSEKNLKIKNLILHDLEKLNFYSFKKFCGILKKSKIKILKLLFR